MPSANRLPSNDYYRTNSMALVSFLKINDHTPQAIRWEGDSCYWYFDKSNNLMELVEEFMTGEALVEPREYNRVFGLTKRDLELGEGEAPYWFASHERSA